MTEHGYYSNAAKGLTLLVAPKVWTAIARPVDLAPGPSIFNVQAYASLPSVKPKNIEMRLVRNDIDTTSHQTLAVGTQTEWSAVYTTIDYVDLDPLYRIEVWHDGGGVMTFSTVIVKVLSPSEYVSGRISK